MWQCSLVVFLILALGCKEEQKQPSVSQLKTTVEVVQDTEVPAYEDLAGNAIALSDYHGKKLVLSYWATWCRPCIEEMPSLMRAQDILKDENYIFLLPSDQSVKVIKNFMAKEKFDLSFIKFNGAFSEVGISALPTTFIYNEAGEQVEKIVGGVEWDSPEMIRKLKEMNK